MIEPGPCLDALIAEKVMDFKYVHAFEFEHGGKSQHGIIMTENSTYFLPPYSTDISAAWKVVEKMQKNDWAIILDNMQDYLGNWQAHFEKDKFVETAESESVPHAICLAALKAVGVEI